MTSVRCWRSRAHRFPCRCCSPPIISNIVIIAMSIVMIVVTAISSTSRGKTKKSLGRVHQPKELADDLWLWKQECPDSQREAFIFPDLSWSAKAVQTFGFSDDMKSTSGKRRYRKQIVGTVVELRNRGEAEKAIIALRSSINAEIGTPKSVCNLAAHYRKHELTTERKAFSTIESHRVLFRRHIEPPIQVPNNPRKIADSIPIAILK
jgi:hypothetical protein